MFFPRLRRHAKWMFVFLALVFGVGFVAFGVGAGGTGIGDLFRGGGGSSGVPSVSKAQKAAAANPKDAQAWRDLSTALQTDGQTDQAITALQRYTALKPKDVEGLRELAGLFLAQGSEQQQTAQLAQLRRAYASPGQNFPGVLSLNGQSLVADKIGLTVDQQTAEAVNTAASKAQDAFASSVSTYQRIAALQPKDPNVQLELAQAAQQVGATSTAIAGYRQFLKLAPDDPSAPIVKQQLKALQKAVAASQVSGSGSGSSG